MEPTYNDRHYNGYDQEGELSPGGGGVGVRTLRGENSYAMSPDDGSGDSAIGLRTSFETYMGYDGGRHSCE